MIIGWRLVKKKYEGAVLSGEGASRHPGRWNSFGVPMAYVCSTPSLAVLEARVNAGPEGESLRYLLCRIEIPTNLVTEIGKNDLPFDWNSLPPSSSTREIGTRWALSGRSAVLRVPSVLVPEEFNLLLNPLHPEFKKIRNTNKQDYSLDPRLWR